MRAFSWSNKVCSFALFLSVAGTSRSAADPNCGLLCCLPSVTVTSSPESPGSLLDSEAAPAFCLSQIPAAFCQEPPLTITALTPRRPFSLQSTITSLSGLLASLQEASVKQFNSTLEDHHSPKTPIALSDGSPLPSSVFRNLVTRKPVSTSLSCLSFQKSLNQHCNSQLSFSSSEPSLWKKKKKPPKHYRLLVPIECYFPA